MMSVRRWLLLAFLTCCGHRANSHRIEAGAATEGDLVAIDLRKDGAESEPSVLQETSGPPTSTSAEVPTADDAAATKLREVFAKQSTVYFRLDSEPCSSWVGVQTWEDETETHRAAPAFARTDDADNERTAFEFHFTDDGALTLLGPRRLFYREGKYFRTSEPKCRTSDGGEPRCVVTRGPYVSAAVRLVPISATAEQLRLRSVAPGGLSCTHHQELPRTEVWFLTRSACEAHPTQGCD